MYAVIYRFKVIQGKEVAFENLWRAVTKAFMAHAEGLGSRLHKTEAGVYIAYAQWPSKNHWKSAKEKLPESDLEIIQNMNDCCETATVLHQMEVMDDLLVFPST
ncbi:antibiotic biosynthesis monooxygenase [Muricauda ruestringensis]|uniref:ABM domain-containing protein n=1 Tax=Flagellimonas marinaquae TaxID=254955 RepID=A0AA48HBB2_9FLAO|nr:antibiotic biosynthesis monooxygenase [Allomuricauda ruestringensis]MCA0959788.1 antibiotic biosynthesis monooxygenase [Allomuricauda ruestringensis]BDW93729.1 hypothetical protein MACH07_25610 [Allomuricauda aquimarina]